MNNDKNDSTTDCPKRSLLVRVIDRICDGTGNPITQEELDEIAREAFTIENPFTSKKKNLSPIWGEPITSELFKKTHETPTLNGENHD